MSQFSSVAQILTEYLKLRVPPVAVCLTQEPPEGVPESSNPAAAGCMFWERAAERAFVTSPKDHQNCSVGMYTHHMPLATELDQANLNDSLKVFTDLGYLRPEEIARIPTLKAEWKYFVYAPLSTTPLPPTVVLLFVNSGQGLIVTEAAQQIEPNAPLAFGHPACAIIPEVVNTGKAALSLGCCGARAYLNTLTDDIGLWALPGARIAEYAERIRVLALANSTLGKFHQFRREDIAGGERPSVRESIARLQNSE